MSWRPDRYAGLRELLGGDRLQREVDEELETHVAMRAEELELSGLGAAAAREEALRRLGDAGRHRREMRAIDESIERERRRMELFDTIRRETRHSLRSLGRAPLFTAVAVLTLGLGVGATTAVFVLLNSIVLRPLPYPDPDRLVQLWHAVPRVGPEDRWGNAVASYFHYADGNRSFEALGAYTTGMPSLSGDGEAERVAAAIVTPSVLEVLGIGTVQGRSFTEEEALPGAEPVVLLSHELWHARYGGDPSIIGRTIDVNAQPATVLGIVEPGATLPSHDTRLWLALRLDRDARPVNSHFLGVFGRLRPGVTVDMAQADLQRVANRFPELMPEAYSEGFINTTGFHPLVTTVRSEVLGRIDRVLWMLLGAVSLVLLIACANVANLFMVRAETRRREQTVRAALGAERAHFAVHYLTESTLIAVAAGLAGVLLAWGGVELLVSLSPVDVPRLHDVALGGAGAAFAFIVALLMAVLFGGAQLLRRPDFGELRESGRGMTASRRRQFARGTLVVVQVGLALVLLAAGGLMLRSFVNLNGVRAGVDVENVLTFGAFTPAARYPDRDAVLQFQRQLVERIEALPGVERVAATSRTPLSGASGCSYTTVEGHVYTADERPPCMPNVFVLPGYFEAMGIPVTGRGFTWADVDARAGVAVVSRAFADRMWPGEDPIGKGVISFEDGPPWYRVVGVADDVRSDGLDEPPIQSVYFPPVPMEGACCGPSLGGLTFVVRSATSDPSTHAAAIRRIVAELDPEVPIASMRTMRDIVTASPAMARVSFTMMLLGVAAGMALFLSAVGLYGVIAYLVGRRRAEIGVRMALGARVSEVARLVVLQSLRLAGLGVIVGVVAALLTTGLLRSLLFEVRPADPLTLAGVSALLLLVALLASLLPARRAARTDPVEALRSD